MSEDAFVKEIEETMDKVNSLVEQAEGRISETDALYDSIGLERGHLKKFLESDKFTPEQKKKAQEEQRQWQQELEQDIEIAVTLKSGSSLTGKSARMSMKRNIVRI